MVSAATVCWLATAPAAAATTAAATATTATTDSTACGRPTAADSDETPAGDDVATSVIDALMVLQAAIGTRACEPCICDVDSSADIASSDALLVLRRAVGADVELSCPLCEAQIQALCEDSGGVWDTASCGHHVCGAPPDCTAAIPGCDCGDDRVFVDRLGCRLSSECGVSERELCEATGGVWDECLCGSITCQFLPTCLACLGGCACGGVWPFFGFDDQIGCVPCFAR